MDIAQKRMIVTHLVEKVFLPQVAIGLNEFLKEYDKIIKERVDYVMLTGYDIGIKKQITLTLETPIKQLVENIIVSVN